MSIRVKKIPLPSKTRIIRNVEGFVAQSIPPTWSLKTKPETLPRGNRIDLLAEVKSPDGKNCPLRDLGEAVDLLTGRAGPG